MRKSVESAEILGYLKEEWTRAHEYAIKLGWGDERSQMHISWCIGMKEMAEALIGVCINLQRDGKVTLGVDGEVEL